MSRHARIFKEWITRHVMSNHHSLNVGVFLYMPISVLKSRLVSPQYTLHLLKSGIAKKLEDKT